MLKFTPLEFETKLALSKLSKSILTAKVVFQSRHTPFKFADSPLLAVARSQTEAKSPSLQLWISPTPLFRTSKARVSAPVSAFCYIYIIKIEAQIYTTEALEIDDLLLALVIGM